MGNARYRSLKKENGLEIRNQLCRKNIEFVMMRFVNYKDFHFIFFLEKRFQMKRAGEKEGLEMLKERVTPFGIPSVERGKSP